MLNFGFHVERKVSSNLLLSMNFAALRSRRRFKFVDEGPEDPRPIEEIVKSIDTTITPEQKEYVEKIKRSIRGGGSKPKKCKY
jgi:hypothetical protein